MKLIKSLTFGLVRLVRCAWTLTYCAFFVVGLVQLHAAIVDPVAIPHMMEMSVNFLTNLNPFA